LFPVLLGLNKVQNHTTMQAVTRSTYWGYNRIRCVAMHCKVKTSSPTSLRHISRWIR
jgi:hypothetical protein